MACSYIFQFVSARFLQYFLLLGFVGCPVSISVPKAGTKTHDAVFQVGDWKNEGFHLQILAIWDRMAVASMNKNKFAMKMFTLFGNFFSEQYYDTAADDNCI